MKSTISMKSAGRNSYRVFKLPINGSSWTFQPRGNSVVITYAAPSAAEIEARGLRLNRDGMAETEIDLTQGHFSFDDCDEITRPELAKLCFDYVTEAAA